MSAFQESDRDYFFGREKFVEQLVNAITSQPLVAVIGPSGSGKSSVVRAGLFPQLLVQDNWLIVSFRPGYPNNNPFWNLVSVLVPLLETQINENERLEKIHQQSEQLSKGEIQLSDAIADISQKHSCKRLLLFVDQFEELYARCFRNTQEQRHLIQKQQSFTQEQQHFVDTLLAAVHSDSCPVTLVLTLRLDFYRYALDYLRFAQVLEPSHLPILGAMNQTEMLSCIERPAEKMGVKLEQGLTQRILDDVRREPGNLPLLEFALTQLWAKQSRGLLTHQAYTEIGGVAKALALHAETVYTELSEEEQKQAQRLFVQLVRPGEGTEDTRRLATRGEVGNWELVTFLAGDKARLVVTGSDEQTQEQTVEIVHSALIREWGRLHGWMDSDRTFRTWQEGLRVAMYQWEESDRDLGALLRGKPLADAEDWLRKRKADLEAEQDYIEKSLALRKREKEERNLRLRLTVLGLMGFSFLAGGSWAGVEWWQRGIADAESLGTTALKNFESGAGEIEALVSAMQAGHKLKKLALWHGQCLQDCPATTPLLALQTIVDNIHQKNQINTYQKGINSLRFIQNDQQIVTAGDDGSVRWRDLKRNRLSSPKLHNQSIISIDFIPDKNILITGASNGWVKLWDISQIWNSSGKKVKPLQTKPMYHTCANGDKLTEYQLPESKDTKCRVNNVRFIPKINLIASTGDDGKLRLWKLNGEPIKAVNAHKGSIKSLNPSPDGEQLATAGEDNVAHLWDFNGERLQSFKGHQDSVNSIWYKPDSPQVATASDDGTVKLWDVNNGEFVKGFPAHFEGVESVRISSADKQQIATAGKHGTVRLWDLDGKRLAELKGHQGSVVSIRFNKDGKTLATSGKDDGTVRLWNTSKQKKHLALRGHSKSVNSVRFNPENPQQIATASDDGTVKLWNFMGNKWVETERYETDHGSVKSVRFSPNGQQIATAGSDGKVKLWQLTGKMEIEFKTDQGNVESVNFSPNGQQIATAGSDGTVKLWDLTGKLLKPFKLEDEDEDMVESVRFSRDGKLLAIVGSDGKAKLWNINGKERELEGHRGSVYSASFSNDGKRLATAGDDGIVRLWDIKGKKLAEFKTYQGRVRNISFSLDDKLLATVAANHTVRLWNLSKRQLVAEYKGHKGSVRSVDFSPKDNKLVTASEDGTAIVWSITGLDDLLNEGCDWLNDYLTTHPEAKKELHVCLKR